MTRHMPRRSPWKRSDDAGSAVEDSKRFVRSAGSRTVGDIVRTLLGHGRLPEQDMDDVKDGKTIRVVTYVNPGDNSPARRYVAMGATSTARDDVEAVLGAAPYRVFGVDRVKTWAIDGAAFACLSGSSADGRTWTIAVPKIDIPVVRYSLSQLRPHNPVE